MDKLYTRQILKKYANRSEKSSEPFGCYKNFRLTHR